MLSFASFAFCCLQLPVFSGYLDSHKDITQLCGTGFYCSWAAYNYFLADWAGLGSQEMCGFLWGPHWPLIRLTFEAGDCLERSKPRTLHQSSSGRGAGRGRALQTSRGWGKLHVFSLLSGQLDPTVLSKSFSFGLFREMGRCIIWYRLSLVPSLPEVDVL